MSSVPPTYMPARRRTCSSPSRTWILGAVWSPVTAMALPRNDHRIGHRQAGRRLLAHVTAARAEDRGDFATITKTGFSAQQVFVAWYEAVRWTDELVRALHSLPSAAAAHRAGPALRRGD